jgi:hypothetical protein
MPVASFKQKVGTPVVACAGALTRKCNTNLLACLHAKPVIFDTQIFLSCLPVLPPTAGRRLEQAAAAQAEKEAEDRR